MGSRRTTRILICAIALVAVARVGEAQFVYEPAGGSVGNAATGENYVVEFAANLWTPTPDLVIASEALGIVGTPIDLVADLNVATKQLVEYRFVFRAGRKHKSRLHYLPINYSSSTILQASLVFNGIRYEAGVPIDVTLKWNAWRIGYQYDVVSRSGGSSVSSWSRSTPTSRPTSCPTSATSSLACERLSRPPASSRADT